MRERKNSYVSFEHDEKSEKIECDQKGNRKGSMKK